MYLYLDIYIRKQDKNTKTDIHFLQCIEWCYNNGELKFDV